MNAKQSMKVDIIHTSAVLECKSILCMLVGSLLVGRQEEHTACRNRVVGIGVVISLERGANCLHMVQLMPLYLKSSSSVASFQSRLVLPFWYRLTHIVLEKKLLMGVSYY